MTGPYGKCKNITLYCAKCAFITLCIIQGGFLVVFRRDIAAKLCGQMLRSFLNTISNSSSVYHKLRRSFCFRSSVVLEIR